MSKVIQFTITERNMKIIENFTKKYGTSKSEVVNRAIEHLAGQYHRKLIISYELADEKAIDKYYQETLFKNDSKLTKDEELMTDAEFYETIKNTIK